MVYTSSAVTSSSGSMGSSGESLFCGPNAVSNPYSFLQELGSGETSEVPSLCSSTETLSEETPNLSSILNSLQKEKGTDALQLKTKLPYAWVFWYLRPPQGLKSTQLNFESLLKYIGTMQTLQEFWSIYLTLKRPDELSVGTTDYSFFKENIRPVWEDPANQHGGKLVIRLRKNSSVSTRIWELLLLALIGDEFSDLQEHICGVVFSIRPYENFIAIWMPKSDDLPQIQKLSLFGLAPDTLIEYKAHNYAKEGVAPSTARSKASIDAPSSVQANKE
ncbi:hypothetical protein MDAP_001823 [Mitosporidium daphniae]|uniref:Eukaryotic translation initiation factor 4E n=1 Tax=Mitosporidium daphniae TaxID=1485682 RepID=A0A098VUN9_9MICR|nr:eukaryotic translation initiation factor 4E [Mitosporidium daphniae]XP_013239128.1 eukaryotic translation initiation factor 4E [Mitosporidium daphniae]KGG51179.1 eukaryotic translation initiation factor 4E [Mitosporidium daphniae]KGG52692.1 eukaryotic translation initiation factor 4E [Mitosporidium daphniae]|eukprot:XP_013237606.1 eukaryotic translation initiation factor 4E [Mitosporidium daphniae]